MDFHFSYTLVERLLPEILKLGLRISEFKLFLRIFVTLNLLCFFWRGGGGVWEGGENNVVIFLSDLPFYSK